MSGGGGGMIGPAVANVVAQQQGQNKAQSNYQYSAPLRTDPYKSAFSSQQAPQQTTMSPLVQQQMMRQHGFNPMQQMMQRSMAPNPMIQEAMGLQAALAQMGAQFNQPMMRPQMQRDFNSGN